MVRNMGIARDLGYLKVPPGLVVDVKTLDDLPDDEVVLVCTGSQGEPMAALSRMANRDHQIRIVQGDTVILASSLIPGNENAVYRVINGLTRWGANVVHKGNAKVHVSGHASAGELLYFYNICQARRTSCRSTANGATCAPTPSWAPLTGVPHDRIVIAEDGVVVDLVDGKAQDHRQGPGGLRLRRRPLGRRRHRVLAQGPPHPRRRGHHLGLRRGRLAAPARSTGGPHIQARGSGIDDSAFERRHAEDRRRRWTRSAQDGVASRTSSSSWSAARVGKWVSDTYRRRPMILPVVVEV